MLLKIKRFSLIFNNLGKPKFDLVIIHGTNKINIEINNNTLKIVNFIDSIGYSDFADKIHSRMFGADRKIKILWILMNQLKNTGTFTPYKITVNNYQWRYHSSFTQTRIQN